MVGRTLMAQTLSGDNAGSEEVWSSQDINWPISIDELHNHMNALEFDIKAGN